MLNNVLGVLDTPTPPVTNSYESIATVTVGAGGQSTITFSSIPSTYKHLQIRGMVLMTGASNPQYQFNGASSGYNGHHLWGDGSSANANNYFAYNYNPSSAYPSAFVMDILDYSNTSKYKTVRTLAGCDTNGGTSEIALWSGLWLDTSAINQITLTGNGQNYSQYSSFALYGIKG